MSIIQIDRINSTRDYQPNGKKYKIHEFICDGFIDGQAAAGFKVKAIGSEKGGAIKPGITITLERDDKFGEVKYVVPKDFNPNSVHSSAPPPPPAPAAQWARPQQGRQPQQGAMSRDEFDAMFTHAMDVVGGKLREFNCMVGQPEDRSVESEALAKLTSTYIIAVMDNGIREARVEAPKEEREEPVDVTVIIGVLEKKGLLERVEQSPMTEPDLVNAWKASGASPLKFGMLIGEMLKKHENAPTDDGIPF